MVLSIDALTALVVIGSAQIPLPYGIIRKVATATGDCLGAIVVVINDGNAPIFRVGAGLFNRHLFAEFRRQAGIADMALDTLQEAAPGRLPNHLARQLQPQVSRAPPALQGLPERWAWWPAHPV